ncbi:MAG: hypothetical protein C0467_27980 [Planctomycetaceae bacterium]|nr:hypothetical protein [Planctomycetaceae bacterium]
MPNWWTQWAERIAPVLAEWWVRSRPGGASAAPDLPPPDHDNPASEASSPAPAPDPDVPPR